MIVVDASALLAVLLREPDGPAIAERLASADTIRLSPIGYWETAVRARRLRGDEGLAEVDAMIQRLSIQITPADATTANRAIEAEARFGKRTRAKLNLGDCFAYALAREAGAALLYKGEDFARTDVKPALPG